MKIFQIYKLYSAIAFLSVYIVALTIWIQSSEQGLWGGIYEVVIRTDVIGENWIELALLLSAFPGVLVIFTRVLLPVLRKKKPA